MNKNYGKTVVVQDNNVDKALRKFKKKVQDSGLLNDLRDREFYIKPTVRRKLRANSARARWLKYQADQELPKKNY